LTDSNLPRRLGPKRANKIRKLFGLEKKDSGLEKKEFSELIKHRAVRRTWTAASGKARQKAPKI
jgi:small subunit ribosomal protein S6e